MVTNASSPPKQSRKPSQKTAPTTPPPLCQAKDRSIINKLASIIECEIPALTFDYFAMHDQCSAYLELLKEAFDSVIPEKDGKKWCSQKQVLPVIVGFVFSTVAGMKDHETKGVPSEELLNIAADVIKRFLGEGEGSKVTGRERRI
jgi:hypothetical protein